MILDLERLRAAPLSREPFDFVVVDRFVRAEYLPGLVADFPAVPRHGSFPLPALACGRRFAELAAELEGAALRDEIAGKFAIDLSGRPTMITLRGRSDRSFHGHCPHKGERRSVQLNWVSDPAVVRRELARHTWSARLKALNPFG
jgi:hypothetical protein